MVHIFCCQLISDAGWKCHNAIICVKKIKKLEAVTPGKSVISRTPDTYENSMKLNMYIILIIKWPLKQLRDSS